MKKTLTGLLLLAASSVCLAEEASATRYITDEFRADLRSIPSNGGRIVNYLKAGTELTVLDQNDDGWSRIRTTRGKEGWLRSNYLVDQQVAKVRIVEAQQNLDRVKANSNKLQDSIAEKEAELRQLRTQVEQVSLQRDNIHKEFTELKNISGNAIAINNQNQELLKRNSQLESDLEAQTALNDQLKNDQRFSWFMYGAFAVALGALLTMLIPMLKRKRRYSEWG